MLSFPVFAKLELRSVPRALRGGQAVLSRFVLSSIPVIQPICFQTLAHSLAQRRSRNPLFFNRWCTKLHRRPPSSPLTSPRLRDRLRPNILGIPHVLCTG